MTNLVYVADLPKEHEKFLMKLNSLTRTWKICLQ